MVLFAPVPSPLEEVFSKVKGIMKTYDGLFQASSMSRALLTLAFGMVSKENCCSYSAHACMQVTVGSVKNFAISL
jgi:hypothetical protein